VTSPAEQMLTDALAAQKFTRKFFVVELDFGEHTIPQLEAQCQAAGYALRGGLTPENIDKLTQLWGAYFGEVLRRNSAGQWSQVEQEGGARFVLQAGGQTVAPHAVVRQRLEQGTAFALTAAYEQAKLSLQ